MAFLTGCLILDAPASALNNAGADAGARTDNTIAVKKIRVGRAEYPYVSAQAVRYWIRAGLEAQGDPWRAAPVFREGKIAYTDANPIDYWDDDLFGYMRAPSKAKDARKPIDEGATLQPTPVEKDTELTRVSPLRVSTFVAISPGGVASDFGTMTRQNGDPVPYEHEFYRSHLQGLISLDLTAAGTFFVTKRVGYKNLDEVRRKKAEELLLANVPVRKQNAYRLPLGERQKRVASLMHGLAFLCGGAKQTLHLTDLTPAVAIMAVTKHGNNPFLRWFGPNVGDRTAGTQFQPRAFEQTTKWLSDQDELLSPIYVGWAHGFLDDQRAEFDEAVGHASGFQIETGYPPALIQNLAERLRAVESSGWYE